MSIRKSIFDVIEHCSTEVDLPWTNDQGRQKGSTFVLVLAHQGRNEQSLSICTTIQTFMRSTSREM
jgi:hypothetical protein